MPDQPVEIVEYDPGWDVSFVEQSALVEVLLRPWLAGPVEHVGSTSVPGLAAKPVVDMLAPVHSPDSARRAVAALEADGWLFWAQDPHHYRLWFLRPRPEKRTHHLYLIERDDPHAVALLAFRDALRADPVLRQEYALLKAQLAAQHRHHRAAYTDAKTTFVQRTLQAAGIEPSTRKPLAD
jgi:GrpB-like predicted nucleotidyltransferase (UPF0157 family)